MKKEHPKQRYAPWQGVLKVPRFWGWMLKMFGGGKAGSMTEWLQKPTFDWRILREKEVTRSRMKEVETCFSTFFVSR